MGVWSLPWDNVDKASQFESKMKEPWVLKVKKSEEDDVFVVEESPEIVGVFWATDCLYGSDSFQDDLSELANKHQKDFDVREAITKSLTDELKKMEKRPTLPKNLEAINLVRRTLGLSELTHDRELEEFQKKSLELLRFIKSSDIEMEYYDFGEHGPEIKGIARMILGLPEGYEDKTICCLVVETKEKKIFELDFSSFEYLIKTNWEREGLLKLYYLK